MKGQRQVVEDFLSDGLVVLGHCVEQRLLIADYVILGQVVLHAYGSVGVESSDELFLLDVVLPLGQVLPDPLLDFPKLGPIIVP